MKYFEKGEAERKLTCLPLTPVQQGLFYVHVNDVFEAEGAVEDRRFLRISCTNREDGAF